MDIEQSSPGPVHEAELTIGAAPATPEQAQSDDTTDRSAENKPDEVPGPSQRITKLWRKTNEEFYRHSLSKRVVIGVVGALAASTVGFFPLVAGYTGYRFERFQKKRYDKKQLVAAERKGVGEWAERVRLRKEAEDAKRENNKRYWDQKRRITSSETD